jgi:hypothetical protein
VLTLASGPPGGPDDGAELLDAVVIALLPPPCPAPFAIGWILELNIGAEHFSGQCI